MWLANSVMSKQWSFNWIYIFGMWAVLQEGTSGRWAKILLMWVWNPSVFFALLVDTMTIKFILFPVNTPPQITQDITLELLADSLTPRDKFKLNNTMNVSFFFFFLKMNMHRVSLLTWDHDFGLNSSHENCSIITGGVAASTSDDCRSHEIGVSLKQNWCLLSAQVWAPRTSGQNFQSEI